jgi:RNA-directed DNA polymerase
LQEVKKFIIIFLHDRLKLQLYPKRAEIAPVDCGVDFLGYMLRDGKRFLRTSTVRRFIKRKRRYEAMVERGGMTEELLDNVVASWNEYASFADAHMLIQKLGLL